MNDFSRIPLDVLPQHLSSNTRKAYTSDLKAWVRWCIARKINPTEITPEQVALWLSSMADDGLALSTIRRRTAAISTWAKIIDPEGERVADTAIVRHALNANDAVYSVIQEREREAGQRRSSARGITPEELAAMVNTCGSDPASVRDRALILLAWHGKIRRDELVVLRACDITRSDPNGYRIRLLHPHNFNSPRTPNVWIPRIVGELDPIRALDEWLQLAHITDDSTGPVFRGIHRSGLILDDAFTGQSVRLIVRRRAELAGLDMTGITGHSISMGARGLLT